MIGIKGTKRDSIVLGLSVAATHSIVVFLIAAIGLWLGNATFAGTATIWLERGSGFIAIAIGCWMMWRRLFIRNASEGNHHHSHAHASEPIQIDGTHLKGLVEIIETPLGEKMRFASNFGIQENHLLVEIQRERGIEKLSLTKSPENSFVYLSAAPPEEPHEFTATLILESRTGLNEKVSFSIKEPHFHTEHAHAHLDDAAHARAHAATLPDYAKNGERPALGQIIAFGAAGGMVPCPASITVMLLALATGKTGLGIFTVLGFSLGLAVSLVGVGVIIVTGLSKLSQSGRLSWITQRAPVVSAALVIISGLFALLVAH